MSRELEPWDQRTEGVAAFMRRAIAAGGVPTFAPVLVDGDRALASGAVMLEAQPFATVARSRNPRVRAAAAVHAIGRLYDACEALGATPAVLPSGTDL